MNNVNSVESWKNISDRKKSEQRTQEENEIKKRQSNSAKKFVKKVY